MHHIYKSAEGEHQVRERYRKFLKHWPVPNEQLQVATGQGETFVIASGPQAAPPLLLLHGGAANSAMWMADISTFASRFRVFCVDMIGEPGLSAPARPSLASDAYARWLDDVLRAISVERVSIAGMSLGGWLALDYAVRRPERVAKVAVLCPGGVGRQKLGIVFASMGLRLCGRWGKRRLMEKILGRAPANPSPAARAFIDFVSLIHQHFRPRMVKLPVFSDSELGRLNMPVLAIVGGRDVLLDSAGTKRRLESRAPKATVAYLPQAGHFIPGQTAKVLEFLTNSDG